MNGTFVDMDMVFYVILLSGAMIALYWLAMAEKQLHDVGPWMVSPDGGGIQSDDFTHDVILRVTGDFYNDAQRTAQSLCR